MTKTYDVKCYELAEHFLQDHPEINSDDLCMALAIDIQDAIETFLDWAKEKEAKDGDQRDTGGNRD